MNRTSTHKYYTSNVHQCGARTQACGRCHNHPMENQLSNASISFPAPVPSSSSGSRVSGDQQRVLLQCLSDKAGNVTILQKMAMVFQICCTPVNGSARMKLSMLLQQTQCTRNKDSGLRIMQALQYKNPCSPSSLVRFLESNFQIYLHTFYFQPGKIFSLQSLHTSVFKSLHDCFKNPYTDLCLTYFICASSFSNICKWETSSVYLPMQN